MSSVDLVVTLCLTELLCLTGALRAASLLAVNTSPSLFTRSSSRLLAIFVALLSFLPLGNAIPGRTILRMSTGLKYKIPQAPVPTKFPLKSPRGANLATRLWPVNRPKALCLIVHGGGWHSGYFEELAASLNKDSIYCASYDQAGCGFSDQEPGTPGPGITHFDSFDCLVEDVSAAIEWMQKSAGTTTAPVILFGESFGGLQVIAAAMEKDFYKCRVDAVIASGGLLQLGAKFLPPKPVVKILCFLARYYPKVVMPATDFESTFDDAFGDKEWAKTARADPKVSMAIHPTIGGVASTLSAGDSLRPRAKEFPVKFFAVHGKGDVRTAPEVMQEFVDNMGPEKASIYMVDTQGHQLLQDEKDITNEVITRIGKWISVTLKDLK